jgi:hypothetical protein
MRDLLAPPDPFFSAARRTAGSSDYRPVHTPQILVDLAQVYLRGPQAVEYLVQCSVVVPHVEQIPHGAPRTILLWQIAPWRAGPHDPQNPLHDDSAVARRPSGSRSRRKYISNAVPLFVRQSMSRHPYTLRGKVEKSVQIMRHLPLAAEEQFSDKA